MSYLSIDLEMTGTEPGWHEIIQIGAVLYDETWTEISRFLTNVYPENEESFSIPAARVHDLSMEDLKDAPSLLDALEDLDKWVCKSLHIRLDDPEKWRQMRKVIICGQSVMYDVNFLKFAYRQENMKWNYSNDIIDLHVLSLFVFKVLENNGIAVPKGRSLGKVAAYFGFERESDTHNALEDAHLTGLCLEKIMGYTDKLKIEN